MKTPIICSLLAIALTGTAPAVVVFSDDFSTNAIATNFDTLGVAYNASAETVTIDRGSGSNFLAIKDAINLDSYAATQMTFSFNWSFGASMFGSGFIAQYSDNNGVDWVTLFSQNYTGTGANDSANATQFTSFVLNEGTYTFTDQAKLQIIGTTNSGGKGYHIDNFTVDVDQVPEPATALLGGLGCLLLLRRRRA